jgi:hypothetical protein
MASMAIAVLPVLRSPMISSRWPRPMGIMLSIALMPVCRGSVTGWRWAMPGAAHSSGRRSGVSTTPLPSSGRPSGSTTRPMSGSPTGTERSSPLRRTWSPSLMPRYSPRMTTPTELSSRLNTCPAAPLANSTRSPAMAPARP